MEMHGRKRLDQPHSTQLCYVFTRLILTARGCPISQFRPFPPWPQETESGDPERFAGVARVFHDGLCLSELTYSRVKCVSKSKVVYCCIFWFRIRGFYVYHPISKTSTVPRCFHGGNRRNLLTQPRPVALYRLQRWRL